MELRSQPVILLVSCFCQDFFTQLALCMDNVHLFRPTSGSLTLDDNELNNCPAFPEQEG
jgi:hypothetical protein